MKQANDNSNGILQRLCRMYLSQLESLADKYGYGDVIREIIKDNKRGTCEGTKEEVELLSRAVNEDRLCRKDVPKLLNKSYRQCIDDGDFEHIPKLPRLGIYNMVDAVIYKFNKKNNKKNK